MRRRDFIRLVGGTAVFPFAASAQQAQSIELSNEMTLGPLSRNELR